MKPPLGFPIKKQKKTKNETHHTGTRTHTHTLGCGSIFWSWYLFLGSFLETKRNLEILFGARIPKDVHTHTHLQAKLWLQPGPSGSQVPLEEAKAAICFWFLKGGKPLATYSMDFLNGHPQPPYAGDTVNGSTGRLGANTIPRISKSKYAAKEPKDWPPHLFMLAIPNHRVANKPKAWPGGSPKSSLDIIMQINRGLPKK